MYSAPCAGQTLPGATVMPCDVDLRRAAQQHDERRAVVAKQAGIGVEDDGLAAAASAAREPARIPASETQHEFSI